MEIDEEVVAMVIVEVVVDFVAEIDEVVMETEIVEEVDFVVEIVMAVDAH
jgi:hypothetical protein